MMGDHDANFFEIQKSFYAEFGDSIGPKGSGWKQFKRWEYHYQDKVDQFGNLPNADNYYNELKSVSKKRSTNSKYAIGTGNWQELGPISKPGNGTGQPNGNGRVNAIAFHPSDANTIFVGAPAGGFWKSTDNGATWAKSIDGLTRLGVSSIVVHPTTPNVIYIGTGDRDGGDTPGYGVWKSTDGGATWAAHNNGMGNRTVYEILMDPTDSDRMIASTNGSRIYYTTDAGANWSYTSVGTSCKDIAFKPGDPNTIYAAGATFWRSTDGGANYSQIFDIPSSSRVSIAVTPDEPNWVYAIAGDGSGLVGIYQSKTSGASFTTQATTPNLLGYGTTGGTGSQAWYDLCIAADPNDADVIYTGGINIWKSTDEGITFSLSGHWTGSGGADDVHADQHVLEFSPHSNDLYNGNDGGVYISDDAGTTWNEVSDGLGISQMYKIGVSQTIEDHVIAGFQDNGTAFVLDNAWQTEIGGDGMECIIDPDDATYMYGALYYGDIRRSTNSGATFSGISGSVTETGAWVTPYKLDPHNTDRMYAGYANLWLNTDVRNTSTWTQISSFAGTSTIRDIAIAPNDQEVLYLSRSSGLLYRSDNILDASPTFTLLTDPASGTVSDIEIDPTDPLHVFVALGNNIYESSNGGSSWTDVSGTLPNISLNTIAIDHNSPVEAMYIGNDAGIYYNDNTLADWEDYSTDLPNIEVTELEIFENYGECKGRLYAASYGQGLWVSDLKDPGSLKPKACFSSSGTSICGGTTITLTDNSDFSPTLWSWTITPATVTFVNGTNSSSQNPEIEIDNAGTYTIKLVAENAFGKDSVTKSNYVTVENTSTPTAYNNDFEALTACGTSSDCGTTTCALGTWTNYTNGVDDDIDWRTDAGGTPSSNTGPSIDHTSGIATGKYIYLEASSCSGNIAIMETGCLDLDQNYDFEFFYHMYGADMGSLHVDLMENGAWTEDLIPSTSGDQGNIWNQASIDLSSKTGQAIKLRIRGITGSSFTSDLAVDDISFAPGTPLPVEFINISATQDHNDVIINWSTISESRNKYFEVQRSVDGIIWSTFEVVKGVGTTTNISKYKATDFSTTDGINYYRIKQVDDDGSTKFSEIKSINLKSSVIVKVFPNPANGQLNIKLNNPKSYQVHLTSALGQPIIVNKNKLRENIVSMDISHLSPGVYFVTIYSSSQQLESVKVIVE